MKILKAEYVKGGTKIEHFPIEDRLEIMLCGRSNVGKSSFINGLLNRKNLAHTSSSPGKTQVINFFNVNDIMYFVDVPGYGYAKVSMEKKEAFGKMIENYIVKREKLKVVFLLVDYRHTPTNDDKIMYDFLKYYGKDVVVIATKKDKVIRKNWVKNEKAIKNKLELDKDDKFITVSSETKEGFDKVFEVIEAYLNLNNNI